MAVEIRCKHPVTAKVTTITREMRSKFRFSKHTNLGDRAASWSVDCSHIQRLGINPELGSRIKVVDTERSDKVLWSGLLRNPVGHWERGALTSIDFSAKGYGAAGLNTFRISTKFGDADHESTSTSRIIITDLKDAMQHGLVRAPLINGTQSHIALTGITLNADTEDFRGRRPDDIWTAISSITARLATPYLWMVQADEDGDPALFWYARPSTPEFLEGGRSKSMSLGVDADRIANLIVVAFHGDDTRTIPDQTIPQPIDYTQIADLQDFFVDVGQQLYFLDDVLGYAGGLYNRWNRREINNGEIVLDEDLKARYIGEGPTWNMVPITDVAPGHVIRAQVSSFKPYLASGRIDVMIEDTEYDEDGCTTTCQLEAIGEGDRNARMITTIPGKSMKWQILYGPGFNNIPIDLGNMAKPDFNTGAGPGLFATMNGHGAPGEGIGPGTSKVRTTTQGPPPAIVGSGSITPTAPYLEQSTVLIARATESNPRFGRYGGKVHPESLPDNRYNIPWVFNIPDWQDTDGFLPGVDVQEGWPDTLTLKLLNDDTGSITIHFDVFRYVDGTTISDFLPSIGLASENYTSVIIPRDDRVMLNHGDHVSLRFEGGGDVGVISIAVNGWKHWSDFPDLDGPENIPVTLA